MLGDLAPFVPGGAERQLSLLAEAWRNAGHDVLVLGHRTPTGTHRGVPARRIRVAYRFRRPVRGLTFALSLAWNLVRERRRIDVIYCRFLGEAAVVTAIVKATGVLRVPLVVTPAASGEGVHSDVSRLSSSRAWPLWRFFLRHRVQAFNAISPAIHDELQRNGLGPLSGIPNGVQLPVAATVRPAPAPADRFWLFCGRLVPQKGLDLLLEAIALAQDADLGLAIAGDGPEEGALKDDCRKRGLDSRVTFLGSLAHADVLDLMGRAHALVLPSRYEGLSNVALEALASGLPVLSTRCGGIDTYLDCETGWICEAEPRSLAAALSTTARVPPEEWADRSRRSRALAERSFAIDHCAAAHLNLFASLTAPAPADTHRDNPPPFPPR